MPDPRLKKLKNLGVRWDALRDQRHSMKRDLDQAMLAGDAKLVSDMNAKMDKNIEAETKVANEMAALRKAIDGEDGATSM